MIEDENFNDYDEELKALSGEIIEIVDQNCDSFSEDEEKKIVLCNESMIFWMKNQNIKKALWEARNTIQILRNITDLTDF
jgi:ribonucleotide monophosphatase NagD (HAD superfamily)